MLENARGLSRRLSSSVESVRADEPDSVHQMRVAARRLRSVLRTYASVFPESDTVQGELRWLGSVLGEARDAEVLADHFAQSLDALPPDLVRGTVRYRLVDTYHERYRGAHDAVLVALAEPRFQAILTELDALCERPGKSGRPRHEVRRAHRRVVRAGRKAGLRTAKGAAGPDTALHTTRKRAKALRYAAEAITDSRPKAARVATAAKELQTVLGTHQDAVVARGEVLAAADRARAAGEDTFTYGVVAAGEAARAEQATRDARSVLATVRELGPHL